MTYRYQDIIDQPILQIVQALELPDHTTLGVDVNWLTLATHDILAKQGWKGKIVSARQSQSPAGVGPILFLKPRDQDIRQAITCVGETLGDAHAWAHHAPQGPSDLGSYRRELRREPKYPDIRRCVAACFDRLVLARQSEAAVSSHAPRARL